MKRITTRSTSEPKMKLMLVCVNVPTLARVFLPMTVYAAKVTDAVSMSPSPSTVFPSCTSHGLTRKTQATIPRPKAMNLYLDIFSVVKICAMSMVKIGLRHIMAAAVAALHRSTPSWKASMLIGMHIIPSSKSQRRSALLMP